MLSTARRLRNGLSHRLGKEPSPLGRRCSDLSMTSFVFQGLPSKARLCPRTTDPCTKVGGRLLVTESVTDFKTSSFQRPSSPVDWETLKIPHDLESPAL